MPKVSLDLTGQWQFKQFPQQARRMHDLDAVDWQTTNIPSSIFDSLIQAGLINQREIFSSPEKFTYISEKSWVFRKVFDATDELMSCERKELVFDGLDTVANIWFNNKLIGKTNNMFIPHRFDVTELIQPKNNSLVVKFEPALEYAGRLMNRYGNLNENDFSNPCRVYIRKAQYQFGWDFCPALLGCGIWQGCRLEGTKKAVLAELGLRTVDCNEHYADVKVTLKLDMVRQAHHGIVAKAEFFCRLIISNDKQRYKQDLFFKEGEDSHSTVIRIDRPGLWWPAGYGEQNLYQIDIELSDGNEVLERTQKKFGIRTVKLICSNDKESRNFGFEINGKAVYVKGANWVPASIFAGSVTAQDYQTLLTAAADANINMLRVWGGGYYETDEFYRLCDNLGIMVWQDFMFACGYYPDRGFFLKEVEKEAREVIKRLRNHPSLVLWCGNNEIDWMHYTARLGQGRKFYGREIYHKLLPRLIAELDKNIPWDSPNAIDSVWGAPYIPTTPLGDSNSFKNNKALTTHRWDVWTDYKPVRDYMNRPEDIAPFVTEFGLQSMPSMKMVGDFCGCENPRIASAEVERHNYQTDGSSRLYRYVSDLFGPDREPEKFVYFSQLTQARAAKLYVEHLRANNRINNGCLFWQFNDSFPAIDWAAIDFNKEPKALYYYAKRFFAPVLVTVSYDLQRQKFNQPHLLNPTTIVLVNDGSEQITATVKCRLVDLRGNILDQVTFPISASPFSIVQTMKLPKAISRPTNPERCVLHLILEKADEGPRKAAARMKVENTVVFLPDKYIDWPRTQVQKQLIRLENRLWKLILKTDAFVKDLKVSCCEDTAVSSECQMMHWAEPVRLSDNFLDIFPDSEKEIIIKVGQKVPLSSEGIKIDFDMINARRIIKD